MNKFSDLCWFNKICGLKDTVKCKSTCVRYAEVLYLFQHSGLPETKWDKLLLTPAAVDRAAFQELTVIQEDILNFVFNGESLYLYSEFFGNGKTSWSIKLLQQFFAEIWNGNGFRTRGIFLHVPTFLANLKLNISQSMPEFEELKQNIIYADLVVWDDIAASKLSEYDYGMLLTYLEQRIFSEKANIYTGNLAEQELVKGVGNRLSSRIWNASSLIKLSGFDRRGQR